VRVSEPAPDLVSAPLLARKQGRQRRTGVGARPFEIHYVAGGAPAAHEFAPDLRITLRKRRRVQQQQQREQED
jgi:hypothetical protein